MYTCIYAYIHIHIYIYFYIYVYILFTKTTTNSKDSRRVSNTCTFLIIIAQTTDKYFLVRQTAFRKQKTRLTLAGIKLFVLVCTVVFCSQGMGIECAKHVKNKYIYIYLFIYTQTRKTRQTREFTDE